MKINTVAILFFFLGKEIHFRERTNTAKLLHTCTKHRFSFVFIPLLLGKEIGQGEYGSVLQGKWRNHDVALKTLHQDHLQTGQREFLREARVMHGLNHACIVRLHGVVMGPPMMLVSTVLLQVLTQQFDNNAQFLCSTHSLTHLVAHRWARVWLFHCIWLCIVKWNSPDFTS